MLEGHPEVLEACAFGMPDDISGEMVAAAVQPVEDSIIDTKKLRAWCLERLQRESVPERWFVVEAIPRTDRGKISRQKVLEYCAELGSPK